MVIHNDIIVNVKYHNNFNSKKNEKISLVNWLSIAKVPQFLIPVVLSFLYNCNLSVNGLPAVARSVIENMYVFGADI